MGSVITAAIGVAFVAELETLISAKIAAQKTDWQFDDSRENFGLWIAHLVCGVFGAMPPTGVFVRTALNFSLGATHKLSQIMNALIVLIVSVVAMPIFSYLPQASVAALLVFASLRMIPMHYIKELFHTDKKNLVLLVVTTLICVFMDPVYGLVIGMVIALLRDAAETALADSRLTQMSKHTRADVEDAPIALEGTEVESQGDMAPASPRSMWTADFDATSNKGKSSSPITLATNLVSTYVLKTAKAEKVDASVEKGCYVLYEPVGPVVYLSADRHVERMKQFIKAEVASVILSLELVTRVDCDGSESLAKGVKQMQTAGIDVWLVLPSKLKVGLLARAAWVKDMAKKGRLTEHRTDAVVGQAKQPSLETIKEDGHWQKDTLLCMPPEGESQKNRQSSDFLEVDLQVVVLNMFVF